MPAAERLVEIWRGPFCESEHMGHAVIVAPDGSVEAAWGDPDLVMLPRSSCKMIQALPLVESGAADAAGVTDRQLALACASHNGAAIHTEAVTDWLATMGLGEDDLRCGPQEPADPDAHKSLLCSGNHGCQIHNNCSGKHAGFLTLNRHLRGGADYHEPDHPVQDAVRQAFEDVTGLESPGHGIDGCSAPNYATTLTGLARAMTVFAKGGEDARGRAAARLTHAMMVHPEMVAGEGRACTELMRAMNGRAAIKTGAEAVFVAILPETGHGIAVKIADGGTRAAECTITALLCRMGVLDPDYPAARKRMNAPILNRRGVNTGEIRAVASLQG